MGGGTEKCISSEEVICQFCGVEGHKAPKCPWIYTNCKEPNCNGLMKLDNSYDEETYGKKLLTCQFNTCKGSLLLEEATNDSWKSPKSASSTQSNLGGFSTPTQLGCFECRLHGHWAQDCPWKKTKCPKGCEGTMCLWTSSKERSKGCKFLKCLNCGKFDQLSNVVARNEATSPISKLNLDNLCEEFDKRV